MPLIEVQNVSKVYGDEETQTAALRGISFNIEKGEFVAVMGPSGSGKSTLLHIIGFLDNYTSGSYKFEGSEVKSYDPDQVAQLRNHKFGFVFQAFNLLPRTSVLENVKLPLLYSTIPEGRWDEMARKAAESVGLAHRIDYETSKLSGGERQRVAIARALVMNPDVIFADEPTGNLDSKSGQVVMEIIRRLSDKEKKTVVLITHETYTARHAERIIRIKDGTIESDEKVKDRITNDSFVK